MKKFILLLAMVIALGLNAAPKRHLDFKIIGPNLQYFHPYPLGHKHVTPNGAYWTLDIGAPLLENVDYYVDRKRGVVYLLPWGTIPKTLFVYQHSTPDMRNRTLIDIWFYW